MSLNSWKMWVFPLNYCEYVCKFYGICGIVCLLLSTIYLWIQNTNSGLLTYCSRSSAEREREKKIRSSKQILILYGWLRFKYNRFIGYGRVYKENIILYIEIHISNFLPNTLLYSQHIGHISGKKTCITNYTFKFRAKQYIDISCECVYGNAHIHSYRM